MQIFNPSLEGPHHVFNISGNKLLEVQARYVEFSPNSQYFFKEHSNIELPTQTRSRCARSNHRCVPYQGHGGSNERDRLDNSIHIRHTHTPHLQR